jgi:mitosis inhibitor protein kinase SWE1
LNSSTSTVPTLPPSPLSHPTAPVLLTRRKTLAIQHKITPKTHPRKRPGLRRGITEPGKPADLHRLNVPTPGTSTPVAAMFADVKPSPAAFASTGLVKKKSILPGLEIPKFGEINSAPVKRNAQPMSPVEPVKSRLPLMAASGHRPRLSSSSIVPSRLNNVVNTTHTARSSSSNSTSNSNSASTNTSTSNTTDGSVSVYARAAQKNRGLRRKTSSMFAASASSGSIGEVCGIDQLSSPLTPTRPGIKRECSDRSDRVPVKTI